MSFEKTIDKKLKTHIIIDSQAVTHGAPAMHYYTFVLIPDGTQDVDAAIAEMLTPYDEALTVRPYKTGCWCLNLLGEARSGCDECSGTGKRLTTDNPQAKWDYYERNGGYCFAESNVVAADELLKSKKVPFAILTPLGWQERTEKNWQGKVRNALKRHQGQVVIVDCHF
jgi:hypothetical protein